ncbi:MAG TPA: Ca2+-dependent phosphoinositide-specific phospholipase C [Candidatus Binatia bacterium]|nr:Ca2+-dependent phosphoinositide-specific phospholipase C [Candidatus Binatia bacterium]
MRAAAFLVLGGVNPVIPVPIGPAELDALDEEIWSVFPRRQVITPDDVRRGRATLEEAVLDLGWPRLGVARGKVLFLMDNASRRDLCIAGHPSLTGRALFTNSNPGSPDGAFVEINDSHDSSIPGTVAAGYLVRTRADADTVEARANDTSTRDAAIASGAQYVSTDYPEPDPQVGTPYFVAIPDGMPARCNPVNAPAGCRDGALERLH